MCDNNSSFTDLWRYYSYIADNPLGTKDINSQMYALGFTSVEYKPVYKSELDIEEKNITDSLKALKHCKTDKERQDLLLNISFTKGRKNALDCLYKTNKKRFVDYCDYLNKKELGIK